MYLLHAPYGGKEGRLGAWKALVEAVESGKVRSIGVSNYGVHHLDELEEWQKSVEAKEGKGKGGVLSVNQVELHPWLARPDIVKWCEARGILLEVYFLLCLFSILRCSTNRWQAYSPLVRGERMGRAYPHVSREEVQQDWCSNSSALESTNGLLPSP